MNYYIILLNGGVVVSVLSFDNEDAQMAQYKILANLPVHCRDPYYDNVQMHNELN